jgi:hypothetical protein
VDEFAKTVAEAYAVEGPAVELVFGMLRKRL